jgi:hypothetical protein
MATHPKVHALVLALALLTAAGPIWAEPTFTQKAAAEALFQEGAKFYADGELAKACTKFEASHALDSTLGTTLRLADCYDRLGKTASAWAAFQGASEMAAAQEQPEREEIARERAEDLRARLSYVTVEVDAATRDLAGVSVKLNGAPISPGTWGSPLPVNPGKQVFTASAPGYEAWSSEISISDSAGSRTINVPGLIPSELDQRLATTQVQDETLTTADQDEPKPTKSAGSTQRTLGYIGGGLGLAALGVGGYFTYRAYDLNDRSMDHCLAGETTACTEQGASLRKDARQQGTLATIASAAGLALVGVAAVLLLTAPDDTASEQGAALQLSAGASLARAGVSLEGRW